MIKFLNKKILLLIILVFFWQISTIDAQAAPRLYFDPASGEYSLQEAFDVLVKIDTNGEESVGADAIISFDQNKLDIDQVTEGDFFHGFSYDLDSDSGKLSIYVHSEDVLTTESGVGDIATIRFKAVGEGTAAVTFLCDLESDTDSSIWDQDGNDLIDCSVTGSGSYEIGDEEVGGETTVDDEETDTEVPTPTPSALTEAGVEAPLIIAGLGGLIMLLLSTLFAL